MSTVSYSTPANAYSPQLPDNEQTRAAFGVAVTCAIISTVGMILRILARRMKRVRLGAEDYVALAALFAVYVQASLVMMQVLLCGAGHHLMTVYPARVINSLKLLVVLQFFFALSLGLSKISICLFYVRIFEIREFRYLAMAVIGFCVAWILMCILIAFLICTPFSANWNSAIPHAHCGNQQASWVAIGATDIAVDICVMLLPIPMLMKLHMALSTRIALLFLFSLGIFTMVISGIRIGSLLQTNLTDFTFSATDALI